MSATVEPAVGALPLVGVPMVGVDAGLLICLPVVVVVVLGAALCLARCVSEVFAWSKFCSCCLVSGIGCAGGGQSRCFLAGELPQESGGGGASCGRVRGSVGGGGASHRC